jgi:hypothetical protein
MGINTLNHLGTYRELDAFSKRGLSRSMNRINFGLNYRRWISSSVLFLIVACIETFKIMTPWRKGSASDSSPEGCAFKSRRGQSLSFAFLLHPLSHGTPRFFLFQNWRTRTYQDKKLILDHKIGLSVSS